MPERFEQAPQYDFLAARILAVSAMNIISGMRTPPPGAGPPRWAVGRRSGESPDLILLQIYKVICGCGLFSSAAPSAGAAPKLQRSGAV